MDNGFACREERHEHGVKLQVPRHKAGRDWERQSVRPPSSSFSTSASSGMLVCLLRPKLARWDEMNMLLVRGATCLAVQTLYVFEHIGASATTAGANT